MTSPHQRLAAATHTLRLIEGILAAIEQLPDTLPVEARLAVAKATLDLAGRLARQALAEEPS